MRTTRNMKGDLIIHLEDEKGNLDYCVQWISLDGRLMSEHFSHYEEAKKQYMHILNLKGRPMMTCRIEPEQIK